jgi:hypothetical protein
MIIMKQQFSAVAWLIASFSLQECHCQDSCSSAVGPLTLGDTVVGSTVGGTVNDSQIGLSRCGVNGPLVDLESPSSWFYIDIKASAFVGRLRFSTCSNDTNFGNRITVHQGSDCDSLICVATSAESDLECQFANAFGVRLDVDTVLNENYYVQVHDSDAGTSGDFGLTVTDITPTPENDVCGGATEMFKDGESRVPGTTVGATHDIGFKCDRCVDSGPGTTPGVWYRVHPTDKVTKVSVSSCSSYLSMNATAYEGTCELYECIDVTQQQGLSCDDDTIGSTFTFLADAGKEYLVLLYASNVGADGIDVSPFNLLVSRRDPDSEDTDDGGNGDSTDGEDDSGVSLGWSSGYIFSVSSALISIMCLHIII